MNCTAGHTWQSLWTKLDGRLASKIGPLFPGNHLLVGLGYFRFLLVVGQIKRILGAALNIVSVVVR